MKTVLVRAFYGALGGWGVAAFLVQPEVALVVAAVAFVAEVGIASVSSGYLGVDDLLTTGALVSDRRRLFVTATPATSAGSLPRLVLLAQPRR